MRRFRSIGIGALRRKRIRDHVRLFVEESVEGGAFLGSGPRSYCSSVVRGSLVGAPEQLYSGVALFPEECRPKKSNKEREA
jgi:hypothetical protein